MKRTRQIPRDDWQRYFDAFTREHLRAQAGVVTIQAVSMRLGDQVMADNASLKSLSYDPHGQNVEVELEGSDHLVFQPSEIWVLEGDHDDVIATFELVRPDGLREILRVQGGGPLMQQEKRSAS